MSPHRPDGELPVDVLAGPLTEASEPCNEMQELFALTDWSATQLGPVATWPARLRTIVDICLTSRFPMLVCWGPDLVMIYNDGYRQILGESKHPGAWARPVCDVWPEVWDEIGPLFEGVVGGGPATWVEDGLLVIDRFEPRQALVIICTPVAHHRPSCRAPRRRRRILEAAERKRRKIFAAHSTVQPRPMRRRCRHSARPSRSDPATMRRR